MLVKVCINTPHTYMPITIHAHTYKRVKVCINRPMYISYSHLYAGQEVCINTPHTPTYSMYNSYLHLYAGQGMYKYTTFTYTVHTVCTIHTHTYKRVKVV